MKLGMSEEKTKKFFWASWFGDLAQVQQLAQDPQVNINWRNPEERLRTPFDVACRQGHLQVVRFFLTLAGLDHNLPQMEGGTPFYIACQNGHIDVVSLLLGDPRIDVNHPRDTGATPFYLACQNGNVELVSMLLADPRVDVNFPETDDTTPLWMASQNGFLLVVQLLLASDRDVDTLKVSSFNNKTAAQHAKMNASRVNPPAGEPRELFERKRENCPKIVELIYSYQSDPGAVRRRLAKELRLNEPKAGGLFALIVYLSDGYLKARGAKGKEPESTAKALRYFELASRLPLDLQMLLSNRVYGLGGSIIKSADSEQGFRRFARGFESHSR